METVLVGGIPACTFEIHVRWLTDRLPLTRMFDTRPPPFTPQVLPHTVGARHLDSSHKGFRDPKLSPVGQHLDKAAAVSSRSLQDPAGRHVAAVFCMHKPQPSKHAVTAQACQERQTAANLR